MKLTIILIYFFAIILIGALTSNNIKTSQEFILGGRKLSPVSTALGAGVADMSGWIMMALPGAVLLNGFNEIWLPLGLSMGAYLNWKFIARRIRVNTKKYNDSVTISTYLSGRFDDQYGTLKILVSFISLIFYFIYIASGLVSLAFLINKYTNLDYFYCLVLSAIFVLVYVSLGGFAALNKVEVFQGIVMLFSLLIVPATIIINFSIHNINNGSVIDLYNPTTSPDFITIVSLLSWGLGYFGQPHLLVRFMAINKSKTLNISKNICMVWMILSLIGSFSVGFLGKFIIDDVGNINPETIFLTLADIVLPDWVSGIILSGVVSAIMSTISAQLHVTSCSLAEVMPDRVYELVSKLWMIRIIMICIVLVSTIQACDPKSTIFHLLSIAWAGLGCSFGPTIIFSLISRKMTKFCAIMGIISGAASVIIWHYLRVWGVVYNIYEIIPGFIISCCVILVTKNFSYKRES